MSKIFSGVDRTSTTNKNKTLKNYRGNGEGQVKRSNSEWRRKHKQEDKIITKRKTIRKLQQVNKQIKVIEHHQVKRTELVWRSR